MAVDPSLANVPPWVQVKLQSTAKEVGRLRADMDAMKRHWDDMARRLAALEARRRPGRPRKDETA